MSLDIGTLVARIEVDSAGATSGVAKAEAGLVAQSSKTGAKMGQSVVGSYTKALKTGLGIAAGFIAFKSVENFIHGSITAAEELNTTLARADVVFGKSTDSVVKWAGTTDKSLGLTKQAALEYASQLGNVYDQLGFAAGASAKMSEQTTTLAVEIGAFKKQDPSEVIAKITAGFRGQYRGLAQLVPGLNAATVQQEALNETGKTNAKTLTAQEKATAVLALVQKGSGNAQQFYADTAGEMGRQSAVFTAELDNMKAKLGQDAIPLLTTLAHIAAQDVIPAVETAGHDLEQLAKDINGLPAPVKAAGASLLALVLLGPEIRDLAESVGNNLSSALETARIQALYMKDDFAKAGGGAKGLASAIGTGVGTGLRGAASGLLNIVGGPWGLAFLGASAAVGVLIGKHEAAKAEVSHFTDAVKADSGALGENTKAAVVNALSKTEAFKQAKQLGISLDDLTGSLLGNGSSQQRVNDALTEYTSTAHVAMGRSDDLGKAALGLKSTMGDTGNALNTAVGAAKDYASAMGPTANATDGTTSSTHDLTDSMDGLNNSTKDTITTIKTYIEKLDAATGHALGVESANIAWQQSIDDARKALHDNGKTLDIHSQKGRDNRTAIDAMVSSLQGQADALSKNGTLTKAQTTKLNDQKNTLIDIAAKFFGSRDAAKAYIDKLIKIPKNVNTNLNLTTSGISSIDKAILALQALGQAKHPGGGGKTVGSANGNIFYADGGENHVAQIAAAGANRVWAEQETGGEAYIPLAASKRARSTAILNEVADKFGYGGMGGPQIGSLLTVENWSPGMSPDQAADRMAFRLRAHGIG